MSLVSKTIGGLYNGVSQQAPTTRLDTQCELQENIVGTILEGITPRNPTEFVNLLSGSKLSETSLVHKIYRDESERYIVIFTGDSTEPIEVYTLDGTKCTVNCDLCGLNDIDVDGFLPSFYNTKSYVTVDSPLKTLRAVTVADYTFILNQDKTPQTVRMSADAAAELDVVPALIYFKKGGLLEQTYKVYLDGSLAGTVTTSDDYSTNSTIYIATKMYSSLVSTMGTTDWTFTLLGSVITVQRVDGADFSLKATDSYGNQASIGIKGSVTKFTDLPAEAPDAYVVEISGDADNNFDSYYVIYDEDTGVWKETVKAGLYNTISPLNMPHKLTRTDTNTFTLSLIDWDDRTVGDETSSPVPSFMGETINDIFFYKNRLGLLANDSIILSRAGDYFNFFPTTATDVLDDDPIDISVSTNRVNILKNALPGYNTNLLVDSGMQQFIVSSGDNLFTSKSVSVDPATSFETDTDCLPVLGGTNAYFITKNGSYSNVREFFLQPNTLINDAANITAHVPNYLPVDITKMESNSSLDIIFAISINERQNIYVYKYYWANGVEKAQSSWSKWVFADDIYGIANFDNYLYLVQKRDSEVFLSKLDLSKAETGTLGFKLRLDKQTQLMGVYDSATEITTWTLPYSDSDSTFNVIATNGAKVNLISRTTATTLEASGDYSSGSYWVGKTYESRYRFSTIYLKNDNTGVAYLNYRLQLRKLIIAYSNTGYFRLEVTPENRDTIVNEFINTVIGITEFNSVDLLSGTKEFLVLSNAKGTQIDIVNDTFMPFEIQSVTWQGLVTSLSRNV